MIEEVESEPFHAPTIHEDQSSIAGILRIAVESKVDVNTIERLVALHERMSDRSAAHEFNVAHAAFQDECPSIPKTSTAKITSKNGGGYSYSFAGLDQIAKVVRPVLRKHGLSYSWDSVVNSGSITVTCTLKHVGGHSVTAQFTSPTKPLTDSMSAQQEVAAALTFGKRQSLIQVLGVTTSDADSGLADGQKISEEQAAEIEALIVSTASDRAKFLAYMGTDDVPSILARDFNRARAALKAKVKKP